MTYYKVKESADGFRCWNSKSKCQTLVGNELYTTLEMQKYNIPRKLVEAVSVSKREIMWIFGARFRCDEAPNMLA